MPVRINELISFGNHHIEAGLGFVPIYEAVRYQDNIPDYWFWSGLFSGRIGYKYQKPNSKFLVRAGFTPVIESGLFDNVFPDRLFYEFIPFGGVSLGYAF